MGRNAEEYRLDCTINAMISEEYKLEGGMRKLPLINWNFKKKKTN
ncbi:hypothetical protein EMIT036CA2_10621 [Chryseobacterium sp. IT-36CA2]